MSESKNPPPKRFKDKIKEVVFDSEYRIAQDIDSRVVKIEKKITDIDHYQSQLHEILSKQEMNSDLEIEKYMDFAVPKALRQFSYNQPEDMATIISPSIGPTVSKLVSESITEALDRVNDKIENQLPIAKLMLFVKSKVFGVSLEEVLTQELSQHDILGFYIIKKESGLTLFERTKKSFLEVNPQLFSSLLTAIRSFSNDCISSERTIDKIDYGNLQIEIEDFGSSYLAIALNGKSSLKFKRQIRSLYTQVIAKHPSFHKQVEQEQFEGSILHAFNQMFQNLSQNKSTARKRSKLAYIFTTLIFLSFAFFCYYFISKSKVQKQYEKLFFSSDYPLEIQPRLNASLIVRSHFPDKSYFKLFKDTLSKNPRLQFENIEGKTQINKIDRRIKKNIKFVEIQFKRDINYSITKDFVLIQAIDDSKVKNAIRDLFKIDQIPFKFQSVDE